MPEAAPRAPGGAPGALPDSTETTLLDHLEALRTTLWRMLAGTALTYPVGFLLAPAAIRGLSRLALPSGTVLHYFAPMEAFWTQLRFALLLALALSFPWNAAQAWRFVAPGLRAVERTAVRRAVAVSSVLFVLGVAFCVFAILPLAVRFGLGFASEGLRPVIGLGAFVDLSGRLALAFGIMFQAPVVAVAAVRTGLATPSSLARARPWVVVAILVVSAVLTPPDVASQVLLALPTWLLFESGLLLARRAARAG